MLPKPTAKQEYISKCEPAGASDNRSKNQPSDKTAPPENLYLQKELCSLTVIGGLINLF